MKISLYVVFCTLWLAMPAMARDVPDTSLVGESFEHHSESVLRRPEPLVEQGNRNQKVCLKSVAASVPENGHFL